MRIGIYDVDSKIPNLALMKLAAHHKELGHTVEVYSPLFTDHYDHIYASRLFNFSDASLLDPERMEIGGTGWDMKKNLPDVVERLTPDYSFYNYPHSIGFTMRGCRFVCKFCLTPDTLVITESGPKPIEDVRVGELILTHKGRYRRVTHTLSRPFSGEVLTLRSGAVSELFPTRVTAEHPVWTRRVSYRSGGQRLTAFNWRGAGEIREGHPKRSRDHYAYPRSINDRRTGELTAPGFELPITVELMTLIGWYIAEGYVTKSVGRGYHRVTFCLGHSEIERRYAEDIVRAANVLGLCAKVYYLKIGFRIVIENVKLARWIINEFGTGSSTKVLPLWLRLLPCGYLKPFVNAWANGDGWHQIKKGSPTWKVTTVSRNLAIGLREIALRMGMSCTINRHPMSDLIQGREVNVKQGYTVIFHYPRRIKKSVISDEEYVYSHVEESARSPYEGLVYNLEVDEDNSYCTPAFALHNCVVPEKEGRPKANSTIADIWTQRDSDFVVLLDNDFFGNPEWRERIAELRHFDLKVNFSQGLNIRIITDEQARALASVRFWNYQQTRRQVYFAWDRFQDERLINAGIERVKAAGVKPWQMAFYVLIGFDTTPEQDLYRVTKLRDLGCDPYVMPFNKADIYQQSFARWVNHRAIFNTVAWEDYRKSVKAPQPPDRSSMNLFNQAA
jgi:hypothetical protein